VAGKDSEQMTVAGAGAANSLVDVAGLLVGSHQRSDAPFLTGTTVVLFPDGAVASADVRGGGPGTRETDLLDPRNLVERVHAVVLTGGSAYGLDVAGGVMRALEERGIGFRVGPDPAHVVPIVPAAVLFDLGRGGDFRARPDAEFGALAAAAASADPFTHGNAGAGTGAATGASKGGLGSASERLPFGVTVAALVAANSAGEIADPERGTLYGAELGLPGEFAHLRPPSPDDVERARERRREAEARGLLANTTIGVVATDAVLTKAEAQKMAGIAHDGLARAVRPAHTYFDGDTIFAAATCRTELPVTAPAGPERSFERAVMLNALFEAGARAVARAVAHAVLAAESVPGLPSYRELYPSAFDQGAVQ
jgi:putative pantetheine hydrolase